MCRYFKNSLQCITYNDLFTMGHLRHFLAEDCRVHFIHKMDDRRVVAEEGGGNSDEIRFEDLKGSEEFFSHAAKDQNERSAPTTP